MARRLPPGPATPLRTLLALNADPLGYLTDLKREYGRVNAFNAGRQPVFAFHDPELVKEVLVTKHRSFHKDRGIQVAKRLIGEGLLSSEGDFHKRQRRLSAPAFHKDRVASYGAQMVRDATKTREQWRDGMTLDVAREMNQLTLRIVGKTLFGTDVEAEAEEIGAALTLALEQFTMLRVGFAKVLEKLPLAGNRILKDTRERLDRTAYRMIDERRRSGTDTGDLLSMLLLATDTEGDGSGMSDLQLRDEAMTIFLAGHETTANALAWTWYLLAQNPAAEARLHAEVDQVLGGRAATAEDVRRLPYTEHVIAESMRLFPPAWGIGRHVIEDVEIGGWGLKPGDAVLVSQWVLHRDPEYFPNPMRFDPDRWEPAVAATRPKFSYFPFGGGPRICIGEGFAWMEAILVLATLAQEWRLRLVPNQQVTPTPRITLRPAPGICVRVERRGVGRLRAAG
jgi:cytochrome P450